MSLYQIAWVFFLYAFFGWCVEVIFKAVTTGKFVNRGFLNGPVCPIYGLGVSAVALCLTPLRDNLLILYVGSVLLTSLLEGVTGLLMDKLFHHKWWDYSKMPLNIGGYVCLGFSLIWGLACVLVVDVVQPDVMRLIGWIPRVLGWTLLAVFGATLIADVVVTVCKVTKFNRQLKEMDEIASRIRATSDAVGQGVAGGAIALADAGRKAKEKLSGLQERLETALEKKPDAQQALDNLRARYAEMKERTLRENRRILRAFPEMESRRYRQALTDLKNDLKNRLKLHDNH